jgi:hypothetical protein
MTVVLSTLPSTGVTHSTFPSRWPACALGYFYPFPQCE